MKKLFLIAVAGFFFVANSNAQVKRETENSQKIQSDSSHHFNRERMADLNLTPDQKSQMKELHEGIKQQREAIQNDTSLSADQKKDKMKELRKTQMEKMRSILTPEQQTKMKALREQRKENHKGKGRMHESKAGSEKA